METRAESVGMVGLGLMGSVMSDRLIEAGHPVVGFDVVDTARAAHEERGGTLADSAAAVAADCPVVILSLPNGEIMREACLGPHGVADGARAGTVVVDTTTTHPQEATGVGDELASRGVVYLDVGISGNSALVARGDALGVIGGELDRAPTVDGILRSFCREVMHAGGRGDGMRAKLVINHILTLNRFALAEGLVLAEKLGMDPQSTFDILRESASYSKAMDMWGQRMVSGDYEPPASRIRGGNKDLQLILRLGRESGAPMMALAQVDHVVRSMLATGMGDLDNASLAEMLRKLGGIGRLPWPDGDAS